MPMVCLSQPPPSHVPQLLSPSLLPCAASCCAQEDCLTDWFRGVIGVARPHPGPLLPTPPRLPTYCGVSILSCNPLAVAVTGEWELLPPAASLVVPTPIHQGGKVGGPTQPCIVLCSLYAVQANHHAMAVQAIHHAMALVHVCIIQINMLHGACTRMYHMLHGGRRAKAMCERAKPTQPSGAWPTSPLCSKHCST